MRLLHIFIKNPRLGYVKTRLAATVGNEEALRIYHILLEKTQEAALNSRCERWLWYSDEITTNDQWATPDFNKKVQSPGNLGQRMQAAFQSGFEAGATAALIIGSDCPTLNASILNQAFSALLDHDFVLGPTPDGGYYLLGMRTYQPSVFEAVAWSTDAVFPTTVERIKALNGTYFALPVLSDIDNQTDWEQYIRSEESV